MERKFKSFYLKVVLMVVVVIFAQVRACSAATSSKLYSQHSVSSKTGSMPSFRKLKKKNRFAFDRNCVPKRKTTSRKRIGYNHFR